MTKKNTPKCQTYKKKGRFRVYSMSNFKLLVEKQAEIDTIYQNCDDLIQSTVTPKMDEEVNKLLDAMDKKN